MMDRNFVVSSLFYIKENVMSYCKFDKKLKFKIVISSISNIKYTVMIR